MKNGFWFSGVVMGILFSQTLCASPANCPDPQTTSLKWGVPPAPWVVNPFSENQPYVDDSTVFVRANILVAGYGRGVICTYRTGERSFSIWWSILVKIPSRNDNHWIDTLGGYVCTDDRAQCTFYVALEQ